MYEYRAKVKRVVDGDTVDFEVDLGFKISVLIRTRLLGVDTPERGHADWAKASQMCANLLRDAAEKGDDDDAVWVKIRTHKTGKYGRWLVDIDGVTRRLGEIWPYEK